MRQLCTILLVLTLFSCCSQKRKVVFVNHSDFKIDSLQIGVSSADVYTVKHANINKFDTVVTLIPDNKPKSNNHDVTVFISISIKNHDLIHSNNYFDLSGYLTDDYTIVLGKDKKVVWIANSTKRLY